MRTAGGEPELRVQLGPFGKQSPFESVGVIERTRQTKDEEMERRRRHLRTNVFDVNLSIELDVKHSTIRKKSPFVFATSRHKLEPLGHQGRQ